MLYFGTWKDSTGKEGSEANGPRTSNTQFDACEFRFKGPFVRWFGVKGPDHGCADVYLDGVLQTTVDAFNPTVTFNAMLFEGHDLEDGPLHALRIVVRKERNTKATDSYQTIDNLEAAEPVNYAEEIAKAMRAEYNQIEHGTKPYALPETWSPVPYAAHSPEGGVSLGDGQGCLS